MSKKKTYITNKKQRVVLSDILPFETPATFSNRHFYHFLEDNNIELCSNKISWKSENTEVKSIVKILFGIKDKFIQNESDTHFTLNIKIGALKAIPFQYKISHKKKEFRELTIIHPKSQLSVIEFYDKFKTLILYYCNQSDFSIRHPFKVAQFSYFKDRLHVDTLALHHELEGAEEFNKEYENLKTYFTYKEISNIHKFYESYKYHRCEKKYKYLYKFDISKCFDSIYSHSITWALLEKEIVKHNILKSSSTFGGKFDRLLQNLNYGETNGIIIGPEFSRIFAEIILQKIDKTIYKELLKLETPLIHRKHYEIFRYVDDYFIFYNDDLVKDEVLSRFRIKLRDYKLGLNEEKSEEYSKPILTGITAAKVKVVKLLEKNLSYDHPDIENLILQRESRTKSFYVSSNKLITEFKIIIKNSDIKYKDIQNFTLGCIDNKVVNFIKSYVKHSIVDGTNATKALLEIIDLTFFIYTVTPRVNSTIKLCSITNKITQFAKLYLDEDLRNRVFKKIYDEIFLVLKKDRIKEHIQIETLYLLISLKELGREYRLEESTLAYYMGIDLTKKKCTFPLHYFSITVTLFYIGNKVRYKVIKQILKNYLISKFENISVKNRTQNTELVMLFFDLLSCPYLDKAFKNRLFPLFGVDSSKGMLKSKIINNRKYWFTKWDNFNFGKELEAKKSLEVY